MNSEMMENKSQATVIKSKNNFKNYFIRDKEKAESGLFTSKFSNTEMNN